MKVTTCCGCCSLQKGSIVLGILNLVSGFVSLISLCIFVSRIEYVNNPEFRMGMYYLSKSVLAGMISYVLLMLIVTFYFVVGSVKRRAGYVFPFLCVSITNVITSVAVFIGYLTYASTYPDIPIIAVFILFLVFGLCLSLQLYLTMVIFNFYKELVAEKFGHTLDNGGKIYQQTIKHGV